MFSQFDQRLAALEEQHKDVVSRLQESHFQVSCLRSEILDLREENITLQDEVSDLKEEMSNIPVCVGFTTLPTTPIFVHRDITYSCFFNKLNIERLLQTFFIDSLISLKNIKIIDIKDFAHSSVGAPPAEFKILSSDETVHVGSSPQFWLLPITNSRGYGQHRVKAIDLFKKCGIELNWPLTDDITPPHHRFY